MKKKIAVLFLLAGLLLSACGTDGANSGEFTVSGNLAQSQEDSRILTVSMRVPETLNPLRNCEDTVDRILNLIFLPLIAFDEAGKPMSSVAESWSFSQDGLTLSLQLRTDIFWQNGTALTAEDVAFSLETIRGAAEQSVYKRVLQYVSGWTITGTHTIDIHFHELFSKNLNALNFPVISANYYRGQTEPASTANMTPMGNGPYFMESYAVASEMLLRASETYTAGKPNIEAISVRMTAEKATDAYAFDQGMTDILITDAIEAGRYANAGNANIYQFPSRQYDFVAFNFNRTLFQDKNMRQAVAYALPKRTICESVYLQYGEMAHTPVSPKSWLYEENVAPYEYDTTMAATLLKNIGWTDADGDGRLEREREAGQEVLQVNILVNEENTARRQIAVRLQEELSLLGFGVTVDIQPFAVFQEKFQTGDFDLVIGGWQMSEVTNLYQFFGTGGSLNYIGYSDAQTDALLQQANQAIGDGPTLLAYSSLQKRIAEELPYISIAFRNGAMFTSSRIGGEIVPTVDNIFFSVTQWTFADEKA